MSASLLALIHFTGLAWMMCSLGAEAALISRGNIPRLRLIDASYGLSALVMLATGIMRISAEKGVEYYLSSPWFHLKVTAFVIAGVISAYPTFCFLKTGKDSALPPQQIIRIRYCILAQGLLVLVILSAAVGMAREW